MHRMHMIAFCAIMWYSILHNMHNVQCMQVQEERKMNQTDFEQLKKNLSIEQRSKITNDFDADMTFVRIKEKYGLNKLDNSQIKELLLPLETDTFCPYCNVKMFKKRERGRYYNPYKEYCACCGHFNTVYCKCEKCVEIKEIIRKQKEEEQRLMLEAKHEKIQALWGATDSKIKFDELSIWHKIYLGILLSTSSSADLSIITPIGEIGEPLCPTSYGTKKLIEELLKYKVIAVSNEADDDAFSDDGKTIQKLEGIEFVVNVDECEIMLKDLLLGNLNLSKEEFVKIWIYTAAQEILQYLLHRMEKVGFGDFNPGQKTHEVVIMLAKGLSVGESFNIVYRAVSAGLTKYADGSKIKKAAMNSVITFCEKYGKKAIKDNWNMKTFFWPSDMERSAASKYIYSKVLKIDLDDISLKPTEDLYFGE